MKKTIIPLTFIAICLGIFLFFGASNRLVEEKSVETLRIAESKSNPERNLDEEDEDRAKYLPLYPGTTMTIKDNYNIYWDIIPSYDDYRIIYTMQFSTKNDSDIDTVYIPATATYYAKDINTGDTYCFWLSWENGATAVNPTGKTISKVIMDSDVKPSCLNFTYQSYEQASVGNIKTNQYLWYAQHDHEWQKTEEVFAATCTTPSYYGDRDCLYCCAEGPIHPSTEALGHGEDVTGTYGIFSYSTCSKDGWTESNGTFTSGETIRNTDQYRDYADGWESVITLRFSVSVISNINLHYYVSSEKKDSLRILFDESEKLCVSGEEEKDLTLPNIRPGKHTLVFKYTKDSETDGGEDLARISNLSVTTRKDGYVKLPFTNERIPYGTENTFFTVSVASGPLSVTTDNQTVVASIQKRSEEDVYSVNLSNLSTIPAGTTITVTVMAAETEFYTSAQETYCLTITKADLSPTVNMNGYTYGGIVSTPSVSGNSGNGSVTYYYTTTNTNRDGTVWNGIDSIMLNAGTYYMYAVIDATTNYNSVTTTTQNFKVSPLGITVPTSDEKVFTYNGETQTYLPNGFDSSTMTITGHTRKDAGTQDVLVSLKDTLNYCWKNEESTAEKIYSFTIHPKEVTVTLRGHEDLVYSGNEQSIIVELVGIINGDSCSMAVTGNKGTNAGKYTCGVTSIDNTNYTLSGETSLEWTIAKATPVINQKPTTVPAEEGQKLSELNLTDGQADVAGTFVWANAEEVVSRNQKNYQVRFVPSDSTNYETVELTIELTVATPSNSSVVYAILAGTTASLLLGAVFLVLMKRKRG